MRTAISGTWVYAIVLIFMVIMIAYVAITLNYANTFEMGAETIKIIEESEGFNSRSEKKIASLLRGNNHTVKHGCNMNTLEKNCALGVIINENSSSITKITSSDSTKYDYCISRTVDTVGGKTTVYYQISLFFNFSMPVIGDLWSFNIPGETAGLTYVTDDYFTKYGC